MNAHEVAVEVADVWRGSRKIPRLAYEKPDALDRQVEAVDLLGRDSEGHPRLVLEHTLVESFLDQRKQQIAAWRMFEPLIRELSGTLPGPGHFSLRVRPRDSLGYKHAAARIRAWTGRWIRETAPVLAIGSPQTAPHHLATVMVPHTAIEVTLTHSPHRDGKLDFFFEAPPEGEDVLTPVLERAFAAKCPKLANAKRDNPGAESLLLLEIHDIALANLIDLDAAVQTRLAALTVAIPDHVWLADTTDDPPSLMVSKDGHRYGGPVAGRFLPAHLRRLAVVEPQPLRVGYGTS